MHARRFIYEGFWGVLLLSALTLLGCGAGITVKVDYDKQTNFAALRSFGFKEVKDQPRVEELLRQAIQMELLAKGYTLQTGTDLPDFKVDYHAALQKETIWQRNFSGVIPVTFDEGTIAIQILDPKTGKLIWTGEAAEAVDNQTQSLEDIQPEVNKILARFPPR